MEFNKPNNKVEECNCQSSNRPDIGTVPNAVLDPNEYFKWAAPAKKVAVDACIADEVLALWNEGIWTRGSCCGHNDFWDRSIILDDSVMGVELEKAKRLVSENTTLKQWRLVDVSASSYEQGVRDERERVRELLESKTGLSQNGDYYIKVQKALDSNELAGGIGDQTRTQIIWEAKDTLIDDLLQALKNN